MNSDLLSLISLGANKPQFKLDENKKIPEEYLPSYVDDVIELLALASTEPSTCSKGDKYYNVTSKKIFTATANNTWGSTGKNPEDGKIYLDTSTTPSTSYRWSGSEMIVIGQDLSNYVTLDSAQTITGAKTFSTLPVSSVTPTSDSQLSNKKYVDDEAAKRIMHYSTMPTASSENVGQIVQFIGTTTNNYTNGYFYKCVSDGAVSPTYSWEAINVQASSGGGEVDTEVLTLTGDYYSNAATNLTQHDLTIINKVIDNHYAGKNTLLFADKMGFQISTTATSWFNNVKGCIYWVGSTLQITFIQPYLQSSGIPIKYTQTRTLYINNTTTPSSISSARISATTSPTNKDLYIMTFGNTTPYTVLSDYNPANKKYVDDSIQNVYVACGLSAYSSNSTYAVGDYVYKDNVVYVCNTAISTAEDWTAAHWTASNLKAYLQSELVGNALGGSY